MEKSTRRAGAFRAEPAHGSGLEASDDREQLDRAGDNLWPLSGPATSARNFFRRIIRLRAKHTKGLCADQESPQTRFLTWRRPSQSRWLRQAVLHTGSP